MDLAKIRQKARQGLKGASPATASPLPLAEMTSFAPLPNASVPSPGADLDDDFSIETVAPLAVTPAQSYQAPRRNTPFDPIELILAGRVAAGCDEDMQLPTVEQFQTTDDDYEEFLCIRVSDEIYGVNIMQIKEIIKPRQVTEVPRAPSFISGVISLRGVIIPILDMLDRLGLKRESITGKERVVVVKHGEAFTGLLVDEVIQVVRIAKISFEPAPAVLEGINGEFVTGIGRADNRMIILLNIDTIADINLF